MTPGPAVPYDRGMRADRRAARPGDGRRGLGTPARTLAALGLALAASAAPAQDRDVEAASRLAAGHRAAASKDATLARREFLAAVALDPSSPEAFGALIALDLDDAELRPLWILQAALACADAQGRFTPPSKWPKVPREEVVAAQRIANLRTSAAQAVVAAASKLQGAGATAPLRRLERISWELDDGTTPSSAARDAAFAAARKKVAANPDVVTKALLQAAQASITRDPPLALRLARTLRGILQQKGQTKLAGAPPDEMMRAAASIVDRVREKLREEEEPAADGAPAPRRVWTIDELRAIPEDDIPAWNQAHSEWSSPAVATSPGGLYRVETTCGVQTLVAVLEILEAQHRRVAAWCGTDPFAGRPGLVRICPGDADFEAEGRPFWWAGGFQGGDVTTVIARFPDASELANTLAHELTHRFDGKLFQALPRWAVEGRATYVGSCAHPAAAETLDERWTNWNRLWEAGAKGYGARAKLEGFLKGDVADYRHFYDVGYSLWLFLSRFRGFDPEQKGPRPFAGRIREWLSAAASPSKADPVQKFVAAFADGKDGRPEGLEAFAGLFAKFLGEGGSGARPPAPWKVAWNREMEEAWRDLSAAAEFAAPALHDAPTWTSARVRSDPPAAGEDLALAAAELLLGVGQKGPALEAARWALQADEPRAATWARVAEMEAQAGDAAAAWFTRAEALRLRPGIPEPPEGGVPSAHAATWRSVRALCEAYAEQAAAAEAAERRRQAAALRADHDALAELLLVPLLGPLKQPAPDGTDGSAAPAAVPRAAPREPEFLAPRSLLAGPLTETRWARMDTEPSKEWHLPTADTLELGRPKGTDTATSGAVRDASAKRVALETAGWVGGTYSVRTRVRFVSAFTDAAIVVGRTGTDRGVEIRMTGGDYDYAVGNRDGAFELGGVHVALGDGREWDARIGDSDASIPFVPPREVFDVEIRVAGAFVRVLVNGRPVLSLRRATGAPVEGHVLFALERGIVRFEEPVLRRQRTLGAERTAADEAWDERLRLDHPSSFPWETVAGRIVEGLPRDEHGTLLLWYPEDTESSRYERMTLAATLDQLRAHLTGGGRGRPALRIAVPEAALRADAAWLLNDTAGIDLSAGDVVAHRGHAGLAASLLKMQEETGAHAPPYLVCPLWIAIDADGVVRSAAPHMWPQRAVTLFRALAGR